MTGGLALLGLGGRAKAGFTACLGSSSREPRFPLPLSFPRAERSLRSSLGGERTSWHLGWPDARIF